MNCPKCRKAYRKPTNLNRNQKGEWTRHRECVNCSVRVRFIELPHDNYLALMDKVRLLDELTAYMRNRQSETDFR